MHQVEHFMARRFIGSNPGTTIISVSSDFCKGRN